MPMPPVGNGYRQKPAPFRAPARGLWLAVIFLLTAAPLYALDQDRTSSIHNSVLALDSARQTASRELESMALSTAEASDYRDFIVYLDTRIVSYCRELAEQGGGAALEGLPCPAGQMMGGSGAPPAATTEGIFYTTGSATGDARTRAEQTADLDGDFLATLGDFDEMLLKEEGKVAARIPSQRESSASGQAGTTGSGSASPGAGETAGDEVANGGADEQAERSGAVSGTQRGPGAGDSNLTPSAYGVPGGKLPPPKDDDIVARQLREAAEKEPDPELKKKLWEEYWKYKGKRT